MKCIFLDIDGVLVTWPGQKPIPIAVAAINSWLTQHPDWHVVISSSWRLEHTLQAIGSMLTKIGFQHSERIQGVTPIINKKNGMPAARILEIRAFLDQHDISDFIVIDDQPISIDMDGDQFMDHIILNRLVEVNPHRGLRPDDFDI